MNDQRGNGQLKNKHINFIKLIYYSVLMHKCASLLNTCKYFVDSRLPICPCAIVQLQTRRNLPLVFEYVLPVPKKTHRARDAAPGRTTGSAGLLRSALTATNVPSIAIAGRGAGQALPLYASLSVPSWPLGVEVALLNPTCWR